MYLQQLAIHGIRNITHAELEFSPQVNQFFGVNGSGKTSILESIYLLSRGRSFRTRHLRSLLKENQSECTCFGLIHRDQSTSNIPIGVRRHENGTVTFKVAGEIVSAASKLAEVLPVQLINADSFDLLTGPPANRRAFLDWGVFHVEHRFRDLWARFQRCVKQRNSLLRHDKIDGLQMAVWDREFCFLSESINRGRKEYLNKLMPILNGIIQQLNLEGKYSFLFEAGWNEELGLEAHLAQNFKRDQRSGFTQAGPHKADIKILCGRRQADQTLSRGQTKMLVCALKLAQGQLFNIENGGNCLFLIDDLPSELDDRHRQAIGRQLVEMQAQVFLTAVDKQDMQNLWGDEHPRQALFHVEHGQVVKQPL